MNLLKYIAIDIVGVFLIFTIGAVFEGYLPRPLSDYLLIATVCFVVGLLFGKGSYHGVSIGVEFIILVLGILFLIGRPAAMPFGEVIRAPIIVPLLPVIPVGFFASFCGEKLRERCGKGKKVSAL